jgi:hypothetical protein
MRHNSSTAEEGLASEQQKYLSVICIWIIKPLDMKSAIFSPMEWSLHSLLSRQTVFLQKFQACIRKNMVVGCFPIHQCFDKLCKTLLYSLEKSVTGYWMLHSEQNISNSISTIRVQCRHGKTRTQVA